MPMLSCDENDKSQLWKKKNNRHLERALEKASTLFFAGAKKMSVCVVTTFPSVLCTPGPKQRLSLDNQSIDVEEHKTADRGPC